MIGNIVHMTMREGSTRWSEPLYQYDYGQRLMIEGIELPSVYEVHFGNEEDGTSKTMIGNETGVDIPDEYLLKSGSIHVWIYLHTGLSDGETEYHGIIQVIPRAKPTNEEPTPVQQDTITQTIAELSSAVEEAEALAESIPDTIQNALQEAKDSGEFDGFSPIATVEKSGDTATITITDVKGTTTATVKDAFVPTANVQKSGDTATITITDVKGTTTATVKDAFVPTANVQKSGDTATITITDVNGTTSAEVKDAFTPTASVEKEGKVSTISITDANGRTEASVEDGVTFTPSIDQNGILSWSNDGGRPNPEDVPLAVHPENYATKDEINGKLDASEKGAPNGVAVLDSKGAILVEQLPSYVNDVMEYRNIFIFPNPGETGKIYVATNTNRLYRWTGREYEELQADRIAATESDVGKVLSPRTVINGKVDEWQFITGGGGGTYNYNNLDNKPSINNVELSGNKSLHDLGIAAESDIPNVSTKADKTDTVLLTTLSMGRKVNTTVGTNSSAVGQDVEASGSASHAEGYNTAATGAYTHAEGSNTEASAQSAHAEGAGTKAISSGAHAEGASTQAKKVNSHAEGGGTVADGAQAHAEGASTQANADNSHAEGAGTKANGLKSHAEGGATTAGGESSHAEGSGTQATGFASHAEGSGSVASGLNAHSEGAGTTASGYQAHAEGASTQANGGNSHAEGASTIASGNQSHAEGASTIASGNQSHAEGAGTIASGDRSHAEGASTIAAGLNSHVAGAYNVEDSFDNWPEWVANMQYEVGDKVKRTITSNNVTTVNGYICKIANSDSSFTASKWTDLYGRMNYAEIIGNGTANLRSNARVLDWDGNERLMGDIYIGCNADSTGGVRLSNIEVVKLI